MITQVVKIYGLENRSSRRLISSVKRENLDKICKTVSEVLFFVYVLIVMIWELLIKTFFPVSRIFGNEDDIFIFSRNVWKQVAS